MHVSYTLCQAEGQIVALQSLHVGHLPHASASTKVGSACSARPKPCTRRVLQVGTNEDTPARQARTSRIGPCQALAVPQHHLMLLNPDGSIQHNQAVRAAGSGDNDDDMWLSDDAHDSAMLDPPSPPPPPTVHMQVLDMHADAEAWLKHVLETSERPSVQVLEYTEPGELVMMMPRYDAATHKLGREVNAAEGAQHLARTNPMAFVRIRRIAMADCEVMVNSCDNPGCDRTAAAVDAIRPIMLAAETVWPYNQLFADVAPLCRCASVAVAVAFGAVGTGPSDSDSLWGWLTDQIPFGAHANVAALCLLPTACFAARACT